MCRVYIQYIGIQIADKTNFRHGARKCANRAVTGVENLFWSWFWCVTGRREPKFSSRAARARGPTLIHIYILCCAGDHTLWPFWIIPCDAIVGQRIFNFYGSYHFFARCARASENLRHAVTRGRKSVLVRHVTGGEILFCPRNFVQRNVVRTCKHRHEQAGNHRPNASHVVAFIRTDN